MFDKKKYKPQFPSHEPFIHNHCNHPDINININNNGDDDNLSPAIVELINRINRVENDVEDLSSISGTTLELGEEANQAYPGIKGKQNEVSISLLNKRIEDKADRDEVPAPEVYYTNSIDYPTVPSISGIYINSEGTMKFWNNLNWIDISLNTVSNITSESTNKEVPTSKAVYDAIIEATKQTENKLENYVKESEIQEIISNAIEKDENEDDEHYDSILNDIIDFNNSLQ
jgi:hypothetical protein